MRSRRPPPARALPMLDAPVSGGVGGAQAGTLTFMVGGSDAAFARAQADPGADGQDHRARRRRRQRPGRQDLQQHDSRRVDDRGVGGVRAGREARPRRAEAVRHLLEVVRPVLVDDDLLPGAGSGADLARQPRLSGRLHRGDDAEGPEARAGRRECGRARHAARRRCRQDLRAIRRERRGAARFFRHHPLCSRRCDPRSTARNLELYQSDAAILPPPI